MRAKVHISSDNETLTPARTSTLDISSNRRGVSHRTTIVSIYADYYRKRTENRLHIT